MGVRRGRELRLVVAVAFVDHHIWEEATYFHRKDALRIRLRSTPWKKFTSGSAARLAIRWINRGAHPLKLPSPRVQPQAMSSSRSAKSFKTKSLALGCLPSASLAANFTFVDR